MGDDAFGAATLVSAQRAQTGRAVSAGGHRFAQAHCSSHLCLPLAGRYIRGLLCPVYPLVVEVDGECHAERVGADARRDAALRALGYRVVRIEAALVMRDLPAAVALIRAAL